jgi:phosphate-selective porin OprO/OprP
MRILLFILACSFTVKTTAQQIDSLEKETRISLYGVKMNRTPLTAEERNGILYFESPDRNYSFWLDSRIQLDGAVFFGENEGAEPIGNGVAIRRARFAVKAQVTKNWFGQLELDFSKGIPEIKDAYLRYSGLGFLEIQAGNFKEMFSMEENHTSRYLAFMERPMSVSALAPSRHLGLQVQANHKWLLASAGLFFQAVEDEGMYDNVQDNNKDYGRGPGYSVTAKVIAMPFYSREDKGIHLAVAGSYRTPKSTVSPKKYGGMELSTRNATFINRKKYLDTDMIPDVHHNMLLNTEFAAHYKGFRFQAEYINSFLQLNDPVPFDDGEVTRLYFKGWYVHAGILLFGGRQRYDTHYGEFSQPLRGRKWGDLELLLRYDYLDLNSHHILGGEGQNFTAGLNYYVNNNVKIVLNYTYTENRTIEGGEPGLYYHGLSLRTEIDF